MFRHWSWTTLSRILNVATPEGDWRMETTQMRWITDGEAWYFWNECTTEQDKNTHVFTCLCILSALESSLSRNKCLFILCFRWLCNCFWLGSHHLQHGVARRLRQGALMRGAVPPAYCLYGSELRCRFLLLFSSRQKDGRASDKACQVWGTSKALWKPEKSLSMPESEVKPGSWKTRVVSSSTTV